MAAWVKEEENMSDHRQRKREAEEAGKIEAAPGVTAASSRRFRNALIGPTQGLPKRRPETLEESSRCYYIYDAFGCKCEMLIIVEIRGGGGGIGWLATGGIPNSLSSALSSIFFWHVLSLCFFLFVVFVFVSVFILSLELCR